MLAFLELTNTTLHDFDLFTRVIGISTNSEYLDMLRERPSAIDDSRVVYYEFISEDFPSKWFYQSVYWRHTMIEKAVIAFRNEYKVFIPNQFYPLVLVKDGVHVIIAPIGQLEDFNFDLAKAIPDVRTGMEKYDAMIQRDIRAGYKWKLEFEKNNLRGLRTLFGYYTDRKLCFAMGDILNNGNFVYISKVLAKDDRQFKESKLLG